MAIEYTPNPAGVEVIYEYTKDVPDEQAARLDSMSSVATAVFITASIVLGLASVSTFHANLTHVEWGLLCGALAAYTVVCISTVVALTTRPSRSNRFAAWLWDNCNFMTSSDIQHTIASSVKSMVEHNERLLHLKVRALSTALVGACAEVVLLMVAIAEATA